MQRGESAKKAEDNVRNIAVRETASRDAADSLDSPLHPLSKEELDPLISRAELNRFLIRISHKVANIKFTVLFFALAAGLFGN